MPQLNLNFADIPVPETCLWEQFPDEPKQLIIATLARLLIQASPVDRHQEPSHDD